MGHSSSTYSCDSSLGHSCLCGSAPKAKLQTRRVDPLDSLALQALSQAPAGLCPLPKGESSITLPFCSADLDLLWKICREKRWDFHEQDLPQLKVDLQLSRSPWGTAGRGQTTSMRQCALFTALKLLRPRLTLAKLRVKGVN